VIASVHLADLGWRKAPGLLRRRLDAHDLPGLRYSALTTLAPLGGPVLPAPQLGRVGLIAAWEGDSALDRFLAGHPVAEGLRGGWHVRLRPVRTFGAWPELPELAEHREEMEDDEPVGVVTLGRLRLTQAVRFLRTNAPAANLAAGDPSLLTGTALARPPSLVATFSLWRTTAAMRAYATGQANPAHRDAVSAQHERSFHHASAFVRFRPYAAEGSWDGREPLAGARAA
jgi:hypothetical protein